MTNKPYKLQPLIHVARLLEDRLRVELAPIGIGPRKARVMNVLHLMGAASQAELVREFDISAASMSTMTSRLEAGGFITRTIDGKGPHRIQLKLTQKGTALISEIHAAWRKVDRVIDEAIGEDTAHSLATWAGELRNALGGQVAGSAAGYQYYGGPATDKNSDE
ncbi:MAG: MarR family winged helix-turn-helix transcriptional regulator [Paracoccaceae bacterium]